MLGNIFKLRGLLIKRKTFEDHKGRLGKRGGSLPRGSVVPSVSKLTGESMPVRKAVHRTSEEAASLIKRFGFSLSRFGEGGGFGRSAEPAGVYFSLEATQGDFAKEVQDRGLSLGEIINVTLPAGKYWKPDRHELNNTYTEFQHRYLTNKWTPKGYTAEDIDAMIRGQTAYLKQHRHLIPDWDKMLISKEGEAELRKEFASELAMQGFVGAEWEEPIHHVREVVVFRPEFVEVRRN